MRLRNIFLFAASLALVVLSNNTSFAQEKKIDRNDLPKDVLTSFQKGYPKATIKGTSVEKENGKTYYEIESLEGSQHRDILYTKEGKVVEIEEALASSDIPDFIKNSIMKKYPDGKIHKAEKLTKENIVSYEVVVELDGKKSEVVLDLKGNITKVENKNKENEEKEGKESKEENNDD